MKNLKVIFRLNSDNQVEAFFPEVPGTNDPVTMSCYARIGQHGTAHSDYAKNCTHPALVSDYASLLRELRGIYETGPDAVKLVVAKRFTLGDYQKRRKEVERVAK